MTSPTPNLWMNPNTFIASVGNSTAHWRTVVGKPDDDDSWPASTGQVVGECTDGRFYTLGSAVAERRFKFNIRTPAASDQLSKLLVAREQLLVINQTHGTLLCPLSALRIQPVDLRIVGPIQASAQMPRNHLPESTPSLQVVENRPVRCTAAKTSCTRWSCCCLGTSANVCESLDRNHLQSQISALGVTYLKGDQCRFRTRER